MKTRLLLLSMICSFASYASAAPPVVSGVTASQRTGTKIVDVTYNLAMDGGQTAFVELWFSPDNGLNFPIRCVDVNGSVDANVSAGAKTVTWNAGSDWDQQFTQNGRIRVIATYGSQPSGFAGSGGTVNAGSSGSSSVQVDSSMVSVFWDVYYEYDTYGGGGGGSNYTNMNGWFSGPDGQHPSLTKFYVDPAEITNAKWNEVAQWALANGYSGLPLAPSSEAGDLPRTNVSFWEAVKWCNARSEKDGLTPVYYLDGDESTGDVNGNGVVDTGPDLFMPYSGDDTNSNGIWDPGENFTDNNYNGTFEPKEFDDYDGNAAYSPGLSQVFRAGAEIIMPSGSFNSYPSIYTFTKQFSEGYRLPDPVLFKKMATGGLNQKKWPWGDEAPTTYANFSTEYQADIGMSPVPGPTAAGPRPANSLGLKDVIGNVAEWTFEAYPGGGYGGSSLTAKVYGGSYLGLLSADDPWSGGGGGTSQFTSVSGGGGGGSMPESLFHLELQGPPTAKSPALGFRCASYVWSN